MLFSTSSQSLVFLYLFLAGLGSGLIYDVGDLFVFLCNKNRVVRIVIDFMFTLLACFVFFLVVLKCNYGEFRSWCFFAFVMGFFLERKTLSKLIAKSEQWCYNQFEKLKQFIAKKRNERKQQKSERAKHQTKS